MKNFGLIFSLFFLIAPDYFVWAQDVSNAAQTQKRIENPDFVVESKGKKIELIPNHRANVTNKHDQFDRSTSAADEVFTPKKLGILLDHNTGVESATTGEITFKLKSGISSDAIQTLTLTNFVLVMKPDIYVVKTSTPRQLVNVMRHLNSSPLIEWAEPFKVPSTIN